MFDSLITTVLPYLWPRAIIMAIASLCREDIFSKTWLKKILKVHLLLLVTYQLGTKYFRNTSFLYFVKEFVTILF